MRKNHWVSLRRSTGAPERQPLPSITCSLASTVLSTGSQLTHDFACGRPGPRPGSRGTASARGGSSPGWQVAISRVQSSDRPMRLELAAHGGDVVVGPGAGMDLLVHRRVLGRQAEGVPAHRVQHVEAARPLVARDHVAHRVVAHVAHVDAPRRDRGTSPARSISAGRGPRWRGRPCAPPTRAASGPRFPSHCSGRRGRPAPWSSNQFRAETGRKSVTDGPALQGRRISLPGVFRVISSREPPGRHGRMSL